MTARTYTPQDLRAELQACADTTGDLSEFRDRLNALLTDVQPDRAGAPEIVAEEPTVISLWQRATPTRWSRTVRVLSGVVLAACVAAIGLAIVLLPRHTHPIPAGMPTPDPSVTVPADLRGTFAPGSLPLRNFAGVGSQRIDLGDLVKVPNHTYWLYGTCTHGRMALSRSGQSPCYKSDDGLSISGAPHQVTVVVGRGVRWHLLLVLQPDPDSNGQLIGMGTPINAADARNQILRDGRLWHRTGHGDTSLAIPAIPGRPGKRLSLELTCTGSVHFSTDDGQIRDDYTDRCWPGFIYKWTPPTLGTPTTLTVHADSSTQWVLAITRF
jgi:hypothetical protein